MTFTILLSVFMVIMFLKGAVGLFDGIDGF